MGATSSTAGLQDAVEDVAQANKAAPRSEPKAHGIKLFEYDRNAAPPWQTVSPACHPRLYDLNEDAGAGKKSEWFLEVEEGDIDVRADDGLGYIADLKTRRLTFTAGTGTIYAMRFPDDASFHAFGSDLNNKVFFNTYGVENNEANRAKEMGDFAGMFFSDPSAGTNWAEPMDTEDADPRDVNAEAIRETQAKRTESDDEKIRGIIMGGTENNYLMRGTFFDVMKNVDGGGIEDTQLSFQLTPQRNGKPGDPFTPSKVLLSQGERKMNLLTPDNGSQLHHADIETGKIVSTWQFQKDQVEISMMDIQGDSKSSQLEERSTFLGLDKNRLCRWDLREARGVVQESPVVSYTSGKDFSRGTNFTCMATSGEGYVVVGSTDGKVRLYSSKSLNRANTSIPGLGAPITSVDVTWDGKWVLATTAQYLMLVKTTFVSDKGKESNGFTGAMGGRGSTPRVLRLLPEDRARTGGKTFSKGKFTWITESGQAERWIVANCGAFSVIWNFGRVKAAVGETLGFGGLPANTDYFLQAKDEDVVDTAFVHSRFASSAASGSGSTPNRAVGGSPSDAAGAAQRGAQASLVVATPHRVYAMGT